MSIASGQARTISSRQNSWVKTLRKAFANSGPLEDICAIESLHIIEEAARSGVHFRALFFTAQQSQAVEKILSSIPRDCEALLVSDEILNSTLATQTPQGIAALIEPPVWKLEQLLENPSPLFLCSAGLQDPGNLGTIVRSAEAFGATGLLCLPGTVNVWNAKSVRASAGSVFRLPSVKISAESFELLKQHKVRLFGTAAECGVSPAKANLRQPCAIFIGNEGAGLPKSLLPLMDEAITIPQKKRGIVERGGGGGDHLL